MAQRAMPAAPSCPCEGVTVVRGNPGAPVIALVGAPNAARGLYLAAQVAEHPFRIVIVLTKTAVAAAQGVEYSVDTRKREVAGLAEVIERELATVPVATRRAEGEDDLARADARFAWVDAAVAAATLRNEPRATMSERVDRVALHPISGPLLFLAAMWLVFQITTTVAAPLQDGLDAFFAGPVSDLAESLLPDIAWLRGLIVDGLIGGVGMVLTFVPLMALMFLCLAVLGRARSLWSSRVGHRSLGP